MLGSKPGWLYSSNKLSVSEGILTYMYHFCFIYIYTLNGYWELNSFDELCITWVATGNSFAWLLNPLWGRIYIYIYVCCRSRERIKIYFKISRSKKRFVFFWIYLFCSHKRVIYVYVSSLLLSSENIWSTRPYYWGTQWDLNSFLLAVFCNPGFHILLIHQTVYALWMRKAWNVRSQTLPCNIYIYIYVYIYIYIIDIEHYSVIPQIWSTIDSPSETVISMNHYNIYIYICVCVCVCESVKLKIELVCCCEQKETCINI